MKLMLARIDHQAVVAVVLLTNDALDARGLDLGAIRVDTEIE